VSDILIVTCSDLGKESSAVLGIEGGSWIREILYRLKC
jgi:hypothetical protein